MTGFARWSSPLRPDGRGGVRESHLVLVILRAISSSIYIYIYSFLFRPFSLGSPPPSPRLASSAPCASAPCPLLPVRSSAVLLSLRSVASFLPPSRLWPCWLKPFLGTTQSFVSGKTQSLAPVSGPVLQLQVTAQIILLNCYPIQLVAEQLA